MILALISLMSVWFLVLISSDWFQTLLRHPDCESGRQSRDGVFRQMRTSLQLVGLCVTDGILPYDPARYFAGMGFLEEEPLDIGLQLTANAAIKQLLVSFFTVGTDYAHIAPTIWSNEPNTKKNQNLTNIE